MFVRTDVKAVSRSETAGDFPDDRVVLAVTEPKGTVEKLYDLFDAPAEDVK